jgi:hypothetical protein
MNARVRCGSNLLGLFQTFSSRPNHPSQINAAKSPPTTAMSGPVTPALTDSADPGSSDSAGSLADGEELDWEELDREELDAVPDAGLDGLGEGVSRMVEIEVPETETSGSLMILIVTDLKRGSRTGSTVGNRSDLRAGDGNARGD